MRLSIGLCSGVALAALATYWAPPADAKTGLLTSRSNQFPRFSAPYSDAPASCFAAYRQLDNNRDGRMDDDILLGKRKIDTKAADQCIAEKGWSWAYYLKGRTLSAQLKFDEAARHAEAALAVLRQKGPIPPPADEIWLFRANALMDAGRRDEARPIYDQLIAKRPNDRLLFQLRDSKTWPPSEN